MKYALCLLGFMSPATRLPIVELAEAGRAEVASAIAEIGDEDLVCPRESRTAAALPRMRPSGPEGTVNESKIPGSEWHARALRAWQLAMLRFAVTLDEADGLAVMAIASEIDRLGHQHEVKPDFSFFRQTSAELCAAILQPGELTPVYCGNILHGLRTTASGAFLQRQWKPAARRSLRSANR